MSADKDQFNVRIRKQFRCQVKGDAGALELSYDDVTEAIIAKFFDVYKTQAEREKIYLEHIEKRAIE